MGHIEGERCPFFKGIIRVGNPKQKMAKKNSWSKSRQAVLFLALVLFHYYERESWRDERLREGYARADTHTHTHTQRERRCVIVRFVRVTRERERERERLTLFSFFCVTDELIQTRERKEV
jgi:predicted transcriptional regulator